MMILIITSYGFNNRMRNFFEFIISRILAKNNWKVFAMSKAENGKTESFISDGIKIFSTANPLAGLLHLLKILLFKKPDIIHIFNQRNNPLGIIAAIINKIFQIPLVFTEYGLLHDHYLVSDRDNPFPISSKFNQNGAILSFGKIFRDKNIKANIKNYLFHSPVAKADKIVFVSKHNIELAEKMGLKNIFYLPYIFDDSRWNTKKSPIIKKTDKLTILEKNKNGNAILFIGQMKLRKGWDTILEAMPHIDKNLNPKLIFATSSFDSEPQELSLKIDKLNIRNNFIFLGKPKNEELKYAYEISKLVAMPSRYEGFGLPAIEAWEMQKPIVATDVIATNEHIRNGYNGLLVPPENPKALAEAIEKLLKDDKLREKLIENGAKSLSDLKSEKIKNQWLEFYENLAKK